MDNKGFIFEIIKLYQKARVSKFKDKKIRRGRSHSISAEAEDLFASFLLKKIGCDLVYVDQPISISGRKAQFYPDIVVIKNNKVVAFCDLKMDLGWKRSGLYIFCKKLKISLNQIRNKDCKIRDGITKEDKHYTIHPDASFNVVVVSDQNINPNMLKNHEKNIKKLGKDIELFVLSRKEHPNTYGYAPRELLKKIFVETSRNERDMP